VKRSKPLVVIAVIVLVVNKASDTHFPYPLLNYALEILLLVCMIGGTSK